LFLALLKWPCRKKRQFILATFVPMSLITLTHFLPFISDFRSCDTLLSLLFKPSQTQCAYVADHLHYRSVDTFSLLDRYCIHFASIAVTVMNLTRLNKSSCTIFLICISSYLSTPGEVCGYPTGFVDWKQIAAFLNHS
jgi:hypothetical protein